MKIKNLLNKIIKELKKRPYLIIVSIMTIINFKLYSIIDIKSIQGVKTQYIKFLILTIITIEIGKKGYVSKIFGIIFLSFLVITSITVYLITFQFKF